MNDKDVLESIMQGNGLENISVEPEVTSGTRVEHKQLESKINIERFSLDKTHKRRDEE